MESNILLAYVGIALIAGGSFVASAIAVTICGKTVIGAMKKRPESFGTYLLLSALPTTQGLYGFVAFFLLRDFLVPEITALQASAIFGVGLLMAVAGIYANVGQSKICASGIEATAAGHKVTGNTLIMAVFPELYGLLSLLVMLMVRAII
jgi:V/A-type H+-transporting ATPase subunit K